MQKTNNCVILTHLPSNTVIKCHTTRSLEQNRQLARKELNLRLDEAINGAASKRAVERAKASKNKRTAHAKAKKKAEAAKAAAAAEGGAEASEGATPAAAEGSSLPPVGAGVGSASVALPPVPAPVAPVKQLQ